VYITVSQFQSASPSCALIRWTLCFLPITFTYKNMFPYLMACSNSSASPECFHVIPNNGARNESFYFLGSLKALLLCNMNQSGIKERKSLLSSQK
jgi:hypothetical protein